MKRLYVFISIMVSVSLCVFMPMKVFAGDINAEEQSVIDYCSGTFKYKGKTYRSTASSLAALRAKLAADNVDLDAAQASAAKSEFKSNFAEGIANGYLVEVKTEEGADSQEAAEPQEGSQDGSDSKEETETPKEADGTSANAQNEEDTDSQKVAEILKEAVRDDTGSYKVTGSTDGKNDQVPDLNSDDILGQLLNVSDVYTIEAYGKGAVSITTKEGELLFDGGMPIKSTGFYIDDKPKTTGMIFLTILCIAAGAGILLVLKGKKEGYRDEQA